jgi:hypothetical protein
MSICAFEHFIASYAPWLANKDADKYKGFGNVELKRVLKGMPKIGQSVHADAHLSAAQICAIWRMEQKKLKETRQQIMILEIVDPNPEYRSEVSQNGEIQKKTDLRAIRVREYITELRDGKIPSSAIEIRNSGSAILCKGRDLGWPILLGHISCDCFLAFNARKQKYVIPTDFLNVKNPISAYFVDDSITKDWAVLLLPTQADEATPAHQLPRLYCSKEITLSPDQSHQGLADLAELQMVTGGVRNAAQRLHAYIAHASRTLEQSVSADFLAAAEGAGGQRGSTAHEEVERSAIAGMRQASSAPDAWDRIRGEARSERSRGWDGRMDGDWGG